MSTTVQNHRDQWRQAAAQVRQAMADQQLSQVALAEATGIPRVTLIRRLNGQAPFTVTELAAVAAELGMTPADFLAAA